MRMISMKTVDADEDDETVEAAPDLLAALQQLIEFADHGTAVQPGSLVWEDARAAVAKAGGRARGGPG